MPAQHYEIVTVAIQSLIKAALPSAMTLELTSPPLLTSFSSSITQSAECQSTTSISGPSDIRAADDTPASDHVSEEAGNALAAHPAIQASAVEQTWLLMPDGTINTQAASSAVALCQPSLLAVALKAAQTGNCEPDVFGLHTSHSDQASGSEEAHDSEGSESVLVVCVLAAHSCWCSGKELSSAAPSSTDNEVGPSQVCHACEVCNGRCQVLCANLWQCLPSFEDNGCLHLIRHVLMYPAVPGNLQVAQHLDLSC